MVLHKLEYIKQFDADLKQLLSIDKKYLPIQKKLAAVLRGMNPFLQTIDKEVQQMDDRFIQKSLQINRHYAENMENFQRSLQVLIHKNQDEIDKSQKVKNQKIHELNHNLKLELENIEEKVNRIEIESKEKLDKANQILKRELGQIQKVMVDARKIYQDASLAIELDQKENTELIAHRYDLEMVDIKEKETLIYQDIEQRKLAIKDDAQQASKTNDESYLTIKNTYQQLSISVNKKINELKKKYQQTLQTLEKDHQQRLKPILTSIEELKVSYQEAQQKSLQVYTEKLSSLNVIFDIQKTDYESKKERIIHEGNDQITLLNSKLSAYRETTQKEKLSKSREIRDEIKSLESDQEKDKKNRELTQLMNQFDSDLNKQIIRTNKDITQKKKDAHRKLFELDQKHLKEINEWRLKKVLYEYEKKQDFAKIDLNFNHNLGTSELLKKSEELTFLHQKEMLLQQHNLELLPLEFQLSIAAAVQERELNLLGNDAHVTIAQFKHAEAILDFELKKELQLLQLRRDLAKANYNSELHILNASTQLELEKEKLKRDFVLSEQELRIELSQAIYNKQKKSIEHDLAVLMNEVDLERELVYLENKRTLDELKQLAHAEEIKRVFITNEGRYKHQQRMSNEKATRLLSTYQNELEHNQQMTENFFSIIFMLYQTDRTFKDALIELYHLPSHPEVFKGMIEYLMKQQESFLVTFYNILESYQQFDQTFYIKKIEDLTGYKYMIKHEDMMNYYDSERAKVSDKRKIIEADIKAFEDQFFLNQAELERTDMHILQLLKQIELTKVESKSETKHQDLKELHKELSNKEHDLKRLKAVIQGFEKQMDKKHLQLSPLDLELENIQKNQEKQEKKIEKEKHKEASIFYLYLNRNKKIYEALTKDIKVYIDSLLNFYHSLYNEVYVSDLFLNDKLKVLNTQFELFERKIITHHQGLMDVMLSFYQKHEKEQQILTLGFRKSTAALVRSLNISYQRQQGDLNAEAERMENEHKQYEKNVKIKLKKKGELEHITYKKSLIVDQRLLSVLETKISENATRRETELKLISENQLASEQSYRHDLEVKKAELQSQYDKAMLNIDQTIQNAIKNHASLDDSITNKNQAILAKYETNHQKSMATFKQKSDHLSEIIEKGKVHLETRLADEMHQIKRMNEKREKELKNIQSHLQRFNHQTKIDQNVVLMKELKLLKKTHHSKVKMLHLT